jgi:PAS domain-containing protein
MRSAEFRRIVEQVKVAMAMTDGAGVITFANVAFAELLGGEDRDLVGQSLPARFADEDRKRVQQNVARIGEGKAASAIFEGGSPAPKASAGCRSSCSRRSMPRTRRAGPWRSSTTSARSATPSRRSTCSRRASSRSPRPRPSRR